MLGGGTVGECDITVVAVVIYAGWRHCWGVGHNSCSSGDICWVAALLGSVT